MKISERLNPGCIIADLKAVDMESAIRELGGLLGKLEGLKDADGLLTPLLEREKLSSTIIGHGIAIPHARTEVLPKNSLCLGISGQGIQSGSSEPVRIVFLVAGPAAAAEEHLQVLAAIAKLCSNAGFRKDLISSGSAENAFDLIKRKESSRSAMHPSGSGRDKNPGSRGTGS